MTNRAAVYETVIGIPPPTVEQRERAIKAWYSQELRELIPPEIKSPTTPVV